jgi:hypothetical protein
MFLEHMRRGYSRWGLTGHGRDPDRYKPDLRHTQIVRNCDEYNHATLHCMTLYMYSLLIPIRTFPSDGRTTWVRRYSDIHKGFDAYCTTNTSWYVHVAKLI